MAEITLVVGSDARCSDGFHGEVRCVVLDPAAGTVTHLVVEPKGRAGLARCGGAVLDGSTPGPLRTHSMSRSRRLCYGVVTRTVTSPTTVHPPGRPVR